jgi:hypothetical protein
VWVRANVEPAQATYSHVCCGHRHPTLPLLLQTDNGQLKREDDRLLTLRCLERCDLHRGVCDVIVNLQYVGVFQCVANDVHQVTGRGGRQLRPQHLYAHVGFVRVGLNLEGGVPTANLEKERERS